MKVSLICTPEPDDATGGDARIRFGLRFESTAGDASRMLVTAMPGWAATSFELPPTQMRTLGETLVRHADKTREYETAMRQTDGSMPFQLDLDTNDERQADGEAC